MEHTRQPGKVKRDLGLGLAIVGAAGLMSLAFIAEGGAEGSQSPPAATVDTDANSDILPTAETVTAQLLGASILSTHP